MILGSGQNNILLVCNFSIKKALYVEWFFMANNFNYSH